MTNFFLGDTAEEKRVHLLNKEIIFCPQHKGGVGIANSALMAKVGWKLSHGPHNLAQSCITSKYTRNNRVIPFAHGSLIWNRVGKGWSTLVTNSRWIIGVSFGFFWTDPWCNGSTLRSCIHGPLTREEKLKVEDFLREGMWDFSNIAINFPQDILDTIHGIPHLYDNKHDF